MTTNIKPSVLAKVFFGNSLTLCQIWVYRYKNKTENELETIIEIELQRYYARRDLNCWKTGRG
jgi:hypothetical protein